MKQFFIVIVILSTLMSCGKTQNQETSAKTKKESPKKEKKISKTKKTSAELSNVVVDANGVANVVILTDDGMRFNVRKIKVKSGQKIKLTLKHNGKLDKKIMGHNIVFLRKNVKLSDFAVKAMAAKDNDYIPEGTQEVIAYTKMLGGGETTQIEFTAPDPGTYEYICSFPGHFGMMKGKLIVE